jgi:hypothetical protein
MAKPLGSSKRPVPCGWSGPFARRAGRQRLPRFRTPRLARLANRIASPLGHPPLGHPPLWGTPRPLACQHWFACGARYNAIMTATAQASAVSPMRRFANAAEWLHSLGDVPLERIIVDPPPETATEADLLRLVERDKRLCELIDRVLSILHAPGMGHRPQSSDRGGLSQAG